MLLGDEDGVRYAGSDRESLFSFVHCAMSEKIIPDHIQLRCALCLRGNYIIEETVLFCVEINSLLFWAVGHFRHVAGGGPRAAHEGNAPLAVVIERHLLIPFFLLFLAAALADGLESGSGERRSLLLERPRPPQPLLPEAEVELVLRRHGPREEAIHRTVEVVHSP